MAVQTPNYGAMAVEGILEMLYYHYNELNGLDSEAVNANFEKLY